ncbi:restriction endonuclease [Simplicispira metamorpha]|jgi:restriction system protein|uniref:Restriction system protein n=1 Tax=Simplicispira metamorpha TaxID=80881 RepID=A0A4R2N3V8_9BURK|nr:restriction endonuclease [Simplicispira metamorpha]TCP15009.1 restriction system protein [Simplicispira metamorpha]
MAIPDYETLMHPLLSRLADEQIRVVKDVVAQLADEFRLTLEERAQLLPSGGTLTFASRVGWAKTYLKKAGLVQQPKRGLVQITDQGKAALAQQPVRIDVGFLEQFSSFLDFRNSSREKPISTRLNDVLPLPSDLTPDEVIEAAYQRSISALADEVLERVKACSPIYFERLVVQLLIQMGYGGSREEAGKAVGRSGDGGIDGVINEDRLGLDAIYLQAKRWSNVVGRPDIQQFVGALAGQRATKGVFISTSRFTQEAKDYAANSQYKVVLIDGERLAELMIEHDLGVSVAATYQLKRIDSDFFNEE